MDDYLGKLLQNWAAVRRAPPGSKTRLLRSAAHAAYLRKQAPPASIPGELSLLSLLKLDLNSRAHRDYSNKFFDWTIVYSFEMSLVNLRLML